VYCDEDFCLSVCSQNTAELHAISFRSMHVDCGHGSILSCDGVAMRYVFPVLWITWFSYNEVERPESL